MLNVLMILLVYGTVVGYGGNVYVMNEHLMPVSFMPSEELLTKSLKPGDNVVGIGYLPNKKAFIVLKFACKPAKEIALKYYVKEAKNPVRLKIFVSKDGKNWKFVKEDLASEGNHKIPIKGYFKTGCVYIKIECQSAFKPEPGASLIDFIGLDFKSSLWDKIDAKTLQLYLAGSWVPFPVLFAGFVCTALGAGIFVANWRKVLAFSLSCYAVVVLLGLFDVNATLSESFETFLLSNFAYGILLGFTLSKVFYKGADDSQD